MFNSVRVVNSFCSLTPNYIWAYQWFNTFGVTKVDNLS